MDDERVTRYAAEFDRAAQLPEPERSRRVNELMAQMAEFPLEEQAAVIQLSSQRLSHLTERREGMLERLKELRGDRGSLELTGDDACARCGRFSPSTTVDESGTSPRVADGWASFVHERLVIDVPWTDAYELPADVLDAIRQYEDGAVRFERSGPEITVASVRGVDSDYVGLICGECQQETGWSPEEWFAWFALHDGGES